MEPQDSGEEISEEEASVDGEPAIDTVSLRKMQKQIAQLLAARQLKKANVIQETVVVGPASTTSSTSGEPQDGYANEQLNRLAAVVGNACEESLYEPALRHTSAAWKQNMTTYAKILPPPDRRHINTYSSMARALLLFHERVHNTSESDFIDECIQLVLDFFADIQARLQYPAVPDIPVKVSACVRTSRNLCATGFGSIQGIPSASLELSDFISRLHEKLAEEVFRSIYKEGAKTARTVEIDDFELERKTLKEQIRASDNELHRLRQICQNKHVDTRTRAQRDLDKKREQATDDAPRSSSRQRDRQRATGKNDKNRQQVDDHENTDDVADLATSLSD